MIPNPLALLAHLTFEDTVLAFTLGIIYVEPTLGELLTLLLLMCAAAACAFAAKAGARRPRTPRTPHNRSHR